MLETTAPQSGPLVANPSSALLARATSPWGRYLGSGAVDDYSPGPPPGAVDLCVAIDKEIAESDCSGCGTPCDWRPFHKRGSYLSFSVCPQCGRFWSL